MQLAMKQCSGQNRSGLQQCSKQYTTEKAATISHGKQANSMQLKKKLLLPGKIQLIFKTADPAPIVDWIRFMFWMLSGHWKSTRLIMQFSCIEQSRIFSFTECCWAASIAD